MCNDGLMPWWTWCSCILWLFATRWAGPFTATGDWASEKLEYSLASIIRRPTLARTGNAWQESTYGSNSLFKGRQSSSTMHGNQSRYEELIDRSEIFFFSGGTSSWTWPQRVGHAFPWHSLAWGCIGWFCNDQATSWLKSLPGSLWNYVKQIILSFSRGFSPQQHTTCKLNFVCERRSWNEKSI